MAIPDDRNRPSSSITNRPRRPGIRWQRIIPILIVLVFATVVLRDQFPQFDDTIESMLHPEAFAAVKNCREAALLQSDTPEHARLIKRGRANPTQKGYLVDKLVIGELSATEGETLISITCHTHQNGEVVMVHRQPYVPPPETEFKGTPHPTHQ